MKLSQPFYLRDDVVAISRELLGKVLCANVDDHLVKALITETEVYAGIADRASHAYGGRRTARTEPMFGPGGTAYVYLCYGIHHLFNVVTNVAGVPDAVLVRAGHPLEGVDTIAGRRAMATADRALLSGPGSLAQGLGITTKLTGSSLTDGPIWIEDHGFIIDDASVKVGPRVGVDYAAEDAARPYRFRIPDGGWAAPSS